MSTRNTITFILGSAAATVLAAGAAAAGPVSAQQPIRDTSARPSALVASSAGLGGGSFVWDVELLLAMSDADFVAFLDAASEPPGAAEHAPDAPAAATRDGGDDDDDDDDGGADCPADLDGDNDTDFHDVMEFLHAFAAGDPAADINGDGSIDFLDVKDYLDLFKEGCPCPGGGHDDEDDDDDGVCGCPGGDDDEDGDDDDDCGDDD